MNISNEKSELLNKITCAEILHNLFCSSNHTDGCSWYYETWIPGHTKINYTRVKYLSKVERLNKLLFPDTYHEDGYKNLLGMLEIIQVVYTDKD